MEYTLTIKINYDLKADLKSRLSDEQFKLVEKSITEGHINERDALIDLLRSELSDIDGNVQVG